MPPDEGRSVTDHDRIIRIETMIETTLATQGQRITRLENGLAGSIATFILTVCGAIVAYFFSMKK